MSRLECRFDVFDFSSTRRCLPQREPRRRRNRVFSKITQREMEIHSSASVCVIWRNCLEAMEVFVVFCYDAMVDPPRSELNPVNESRTRFVNIFCNGSRGIGNGEWKKCVFPKTFQSGVCKIAGRCNGGS